MVANPQILKKKKKKKQTNKQTKPKILKSKTNKRCNQTIIDVERKKETYPLKIKIKIKPNPIY